MSATQTISDAKLTWSSASNLRPIVQLSAKLRWEVRFSIAISISWYLLATWAVDLTLDSQQGPRFEWNVHRHPLGNQQWSCGVLNRVHLEGDYVRILNIIYPQCTKFPSLRVRMSPTTGCQKFLENLQGSTNAAKSMVVVQKKIETCARSTIVLRHNQDKHPNFS
ncbi:hypothetical protein EI94DRAFT_1701350 [Lactarius quietus]|nr:hypothetical protein EI94DRAFT_1701350 [Lactarius quietus]